MKDIGSGHGGKTLAQVASNWVMCKGAIPIVGEFLCLCSSCFLLFVAVFPAQVAINWVMCKGAIPIVGELFLVLVVFFFSAAVSSGVQRRNPYCW